VSTETKRVERVRVLNALGAVVEDHTEVLSGSLELELDTEGVYYLEVYFDDQTKTVKKLLNL
jgi:hypothetical protein